ncbi:hypothetical protein [Sphingosinicella sp. LY1275]|uniref:hypothetical protein n=1 Tax=Sphingosinicella sp. LY1275 TaxID=3095379 RepID=UPI002ADEB236|nr:hypothetical protein [Sphingosinicella sp. LY1275]MEA1013285.1 hypothetical protein [Sphingosinicella sp. LY1275]
MLLRTRDVGEFRTTSPYQANSLSDVVKFTALASALAIFLDAAIAHAMFWGNDPYWTYWVTDPLLMATVFGIGTMLFGIGIGRGALITAVHVLLLTTYYWSLSPIGLPSHPEWLDLERTWITGLPVHLAVYYMGYLGAMWLWAHRHTKEASSGRSLGAIGLAALAVSTAIVLVTGLIQALMFQEFPGLTWFVMRIAVATPFTLAWWMLAGNDKRSAMAGGILLAFLLTTYSHYLGPVGLPSEPARLLAGDSPPAEVHWLSYREEFMAMLPLTAIIAGIGYWLASGWLHDDRGSPFTRTTIMGGMTAAAGLIILGAATAEDLGPEANQVTVTSTGPATIAPAGANGSNSQLASLQMTVANRNTHRTPLPPHDSIDLTATVASNGRTYEISATQPMIADPAGRFTTWYGVGYGEWHEGRSGIGLLGTPPMKSDVVAFALADVRSNGELIAERVPLQVSATSAERRLDLRIGDAAAVPNLVPFQVTWSNFQAEDSDRSKFARYWFGGGVLLLLLVAVFAAVRRQRTFLLDGRQS